MNEKPFWQSKTLIVNTLTLLAGIIGVFIGSDFVSAYPEFTMLLSTIVLPVINLILRMVTDQPIAPIAETIEELTS